MRLVAVFVFLAVCAFGEDVAIVPHIESTACGPLDVRLAVKIDRSQHPTPAPPEGKALVFVVNQEIHDNIGIDGKWAGANDRGTYFFVAVDPESTTSAPMLPTGARPGFRCIRCKPK